MLKNKKIFITGGAGFIGSSLIERYSADNHIVVYDNLARGGGALKSKDQSLLDRVEMIQGDILDAKKLTEASKGSNVFVHAAAIAGIDNTLKNPVNTMLVNMVGTANALEAAQATSDTIERFLEFSTSEIFGSRAYMANEETNAVTGAVGEARWSYAVSKLAGEHLTHAYHRQEGLPTVTVRPFNVYGPGQTGEGAISIMIQKALKNEDLFIFGDGNQIRAWCYIDDMLNALALCLEKEEAIGASINIGNSRAVTTIHGLAQTICRVLSSQSKIVYKEALSADIELRVPSTEQAYELLGFKAKVDLEEGLARTASWIAENANLMPTMPSMFLDK